MAAAAAVRNGHQPVDSQGAPFRFSELFAGIGGFRLGLEKLGGEAVFVSEIDREARHTYEANFGGPTPAGDITELEADAVADHDILTAGFPCQSFSRAGDEQGFDDPRGLLFLEIVRVLHAKRPRAFLLENVANLVDMDGGSTLDAILGKLRDVGYSVCWRVLNARALLPQQRLRLYIVGLRSDLGDEPFTWPELPVLGTKLVDVLEPECTPELQLSAHQMEKVTATRDWQTRPSLRLAQLHGCARTLLSNYKIGYALKSEFVKTALGHLRFFSPRECARIQGFPETFRVDALEHNPNRIYHQIGNAVSPVMVAAIGAEIVRRIHIITPLELNCRQMLSPALDLVAAATPETTRKRIMELSQHFVKGENGRPRAARGYGPEFDRIDETLLMNLLGGGTTAPEPDAICALATLARIAHYQCGKQTGFDSALRQTMLPAVVKMLSHVSLEVRRLSVVTLVNILSHDASLVNFEMKVIVTKAATSIKTEYSGSERGVDQIDRLLDLLSQDSSPNAGRLGANRKRKASHYI